MARYSCHLLCAALLSFGAFGLELITTGYLVSDGSAEQACQDTFHTSLASLHSADEQAEAQELCSFTGNTVYCWLGGVHTGTAAAANCEYSWNDGSTFDESVLHRYSATEYCSSDQYMCIVPDSSNAAGLHECTGNGELFYPICSSPEKVTRIGVVSAGLSGGASAASTTLTLWYDSTVYKCVVTVAALNSEYACDSSSIVVLGDDCSSTDTKMLFDQNSNDAVIFDSVFFETADGSTYTVDGFCMAATETALVGEVSTGYQNTYGSPTAEACTTANGETGHIWQSICVDRDDCLPYKQVLYFDTAQPNVAITDAQWDSGMDIEAVANDESCYEGCADQTTMREVVAGSIYACPGTFSGGGTRGAEAAALCASDYHVCESAQEATDLGLTTDLCRNVAETASEFFGTQETSYGGWSCESVNGNPNDLTNDIWGCASTSASITGLNNGATCLSLTSAIGNSGGTYWQAGTGFTSTTEADTYKLVDAAGGGVLCCVGGGTTTPSPTTASPTTASPTTAQPTAAPTCDASNIATFDWDELMTSGADQPQVIDFSMNVSEIDLSLNIVAKLTYEGSSSADNNGAVYGTTYVLDFEDFDAHSDDIRLPGTCQNRNGDDLAGVADFSTLWGYSTNPSESGSVGTLNYLAYPPATPAVGAWTVYMDEETDVCGVVVYEGTFSWNDLVACTSNDGSLSYVTTEQTDGDDPTIILSGTFYINVVSPYDFGDDLGYYRVYQILSQPFVITIHRRVYVLDSAGINVLTISIIAVYKENGATDFKLVVLTEAQEYLQLTRSDTSLYLFESSGTESTSITTGEFTVAQTAESSESSPDDGCLDNKAFICSQLWEISAPGDCSNAAEQYIDFSGDYTLQFVPQCRAIGDIGGDLVTYCQTWLTEHTDIADAVQLTTTLTWRDEECDPLLYEVQFVAEMNFYVDAAYSVAAGDDQLYQVGEDVIYVEIETGFPTDTYNVFDTALLNVWICTFDPLVEPDAVDAGSATGGCFSSTRDGVALGDENPYEFHIYSSTDSNGVEANGFALVNDPSGHPDTTDASRNVLQFSFIPPETIARDKLYVHAQVEVSLQSESRRRRQLLRARRAMANQMDHFLGDIGVSTEEKPNGPMPGNDNNKHHQYNYYNNEPYQQPQAPVGPTSADYVLSLQSPWILAIGGVLAVILTLNIAFLCYMNFCRDGGDSLRGGRVSFSRARRSGYNSVKVNESEADDSEVRAMNVVASE